LSGPVTNTAGSQSTASLLLRRLDTARTGQPAQRAASPDAAPKEERPPPGAGLGRCATKTPSTTTSYPAPAYVTAALVGVGVPSMPLPAMTMLPTAGWRTIPGSLTSRADRCSVSHRCDAAVASATARE